MSFYDALWYFVLYAFVGWCLEVVFCSANTGKFVNRGFLNGPVCPIYGFGAVFMVLFLSPIAHSSLLLLYLGSVVVCSLLELVGGWALKKLFHTSWWDYSDQPFNIGGYICLKFSLLWGIAGVALMRVIHPLIADLVAVIPSLAGIILLIICYALLLTDLLVTVGALHRLDRDLAEIDRLAKGLHDGSDLLAKGLGNTAIAVADKLEALDLESKKQQLDEAFSERRQKLTAALEPLEPAKLRERLAELGQKRSPVRNRLLRAFPKMNNMRYNEAFAKLRAAFEQSQRHKNKKTGQAEDSTSAADQHDEASE